MLSELRVVLANSMCYLLLGSVFASTQAARLAIGESLSVEKFHVILGSAIQLSAYSLGGVLAQFQSWKTIREEFVAGFALFGLGGLSASGLVLRAGILPWWVFGFFYSICGGLGHAFLGEAMGKVSAALKVASPGKLGVFANSAISVFPMFFFGVGGFLFSRIIVPSFHSVLELSDGMIWGGITFFIFGLVLVGCLIPTDLSEGIVSKALPISFRDDHSSWIFFLFVGSFASLLPILAGLRSSNVAVGFVFNGLGRCFSKLIAEVFGFRTAASVFGVLASSALLSLINGIHSEANLYYVTVFTLGGCIALVGSAKYPKRASVVYGISLFFGTNWGAVLLINRFGLIEVGQAISACLLCSAVIIYGSSYFSKDEKKVPAIELEKKVVRTRSKSVKRSAKK